MRSLMQNDTALAKKLLESVGNNKEDPNYAGFVALVNANKAGAATKQQREALQEAQYNLVRKLTNDDFTNRFVSNVALWNIADPDLQAAVEASRNTSGKTDFESVAATFLGGSVGPERAAKAERLRKALYTSADQYSNSALNNVNPDAIWNGWLLQKARMSIADRFRYAANSKRENLFIKHPNFLGLTGAAWQNTFPLLSLLSDLGTSVTNKEFINNGQSN
jgi:hypothetical protein